MNLIVASVPPTDKAVYRLGRMDVWACKNCKIKADKYLFFFIANANHCLYHIIKASSIHFEVLVVVGYDS
jgi:hypothetical protein